MKSDFLKQLDIDNESVFFNENEFAKRIKWNDLSIVVTDETPSEASQFTHGIEEQTIIYRVPMYSLTTPFIGEAVKIDGERWIVVSTQTVLNDLIIRLTRTTE